MESFKNGMEERLLIFAIVVPNLPIIRCTFAPLKGKGATSRFVHTFFFIFSVKLHSLYSMPCFFVHKRSEVLTSSVIYY